MFIGQSRIKEILDKSIITAKKLNSTVPHILLHGKPGLGKTTIAYYIAKQIGGNFYEIMGPKVAFSDLCSLVAKVKHNDIVFIDEIHGLSPETEEFLHPIVEEFKMLYKNRSLPIKPFTLVGATTNIGNISAPMLDRFTYSLELDRYSDQELIKISKYKAEKFNISIQEDAHKLIVASCKNTPRIIHNLIEATRDHVVACSSTGTKEDIEKVLQSLDIKDGLSSMDRRYLKLLSGTPIGLSQLASMLGTKTSTLENTVEPYLIEQGLVLKTSRGRIKKSDASPFDGFSELFNED